jgi:trimethylamine---corrinoid protein Co-methyltransferase
MSLHTRMLEVISPEDRERVQEAALDVLASKGVRFASQEALDLFAKHGFAVDGQIVRFRREQVEAALSQVPASWELRALDPSRSVVVGGSDRCLLHPPGGAVYVTDLDSGRRRGQLEDIAKLQKMAQANPEMDMSGWDPVAPHDTDPSVRALLVMREFLRHSNKPLVAPPTDDAREIREILEMLEIASGDTKLLSGYWTYGAFAPVSPLTFSVRACEGMAEYASWNQPVTIIPAAMTGISAPITPAGAVVQAISEYLAGMTYIQVLKPGLPTFGSGSTVASNMKRASWECAAPETALITAAIMQVLRSYRQPVRCQAAITSSKEVDYQAGYEVMQSWLLTALTGADIMSQSHGTLENLMTVSYEKYVIDSEIAGRVKRLLAGLDMSDGQLAVDVMKEINHGDSYLMHPSTYDGFKTYWSPTMSNWDTYDEWVRMSDRDVLRRANQAWKDMVAAQPSLLLDKSVDDELAVYVDKAMSGR